MNLLKQIYQSVLTIGLVISLLTPSVLNFLHSFEHHEHVVICDEHLKTHLHEIDFDCDFVQLYTTPQVQHSLTPVDIDTIEHNYTFIIPLYKHLYANEVLAGTKTLRGPPTIS